MTQRPLILSTWLQPPRARALYILGLIAFAFSLTSFASQAQAERYAYVDLARAVFEVKDGKAAKSRLQKMMKQRQKALDVKQQELKQLQDSLQKQAEFMIETVKQRKAEEFRRKLAELQQTYTKLQQELAAEEMKIQRKILGRMNEVLSAMGEESNYTMIVRKDALLWAPNHLDITNELIRRYNAFLKGNKKSKKKKRRRRRRKSKKKN